MKISINRKAIICIKLLLLLSFAWLLLTLATCGNPRRAGADWDHIVFRPSVHISRALGMPYEIGRHTYIFDAGDDMVTLWREITLKGETLDLSIFPHMGYGYNIFNTRTGDILYTYSVYDNVWYLYIDLGPGDGSNRRSYYARVLPRQWKGDDVDFKPSTHLNNILGMPYEISEHTYMVIARDGTVLLWRKIDLLGETLDLLSFPHMSYYSDIFNSQTGDVLYITLNNTWFLYIDIGPGDGANTRSYNVRHIPQLFGNDRDDIVFSPSAYIGNILGMAYEIGEYTYVFYSGDNIIALWRIIDLLGESLDLARFPNIHYIDNIFNTQTGDVLYMYIPYDNMWFLYIDLGPGYGPNMRSLYERPIPR